MPVSLLTRQRITLELSCGTNVQRLNNAGIDCRNDVHGSVQICLRDTGFPCVRKASLYSRLTVTYEGNRQPNKYLLTLTQVGHRMRIPIKLAEIRALTHCFLLGSPPLRQGCDAREVLITA
jgi:hypothetical protein